MAARRLEVPEVLRRAWGDEAAEAFAVWLAGVLEERAVSRDEFRQILSRLDVLERDVAALQADVRELRREMHERFDRIYYQRVVQTRWLIGALAVIGTVISLLLAIGQFAR
jgi:tetrahydromethanopterin S-methyltransferase subunit G